MLQPEMEMIPISLSEATIQCPLCQLYFAPYQIEVSNLLANAITIQVLSKN